MGRRKRDEGERSEIAGLTSLAYPSTGSANRSEVEWLGSMCNNGTSSYMLRISSSFSYLLLSEPLFPLFLLHTDCVVSVLSHIDKPANELLRVQASSGESWSNIFQIKIHTIQVLLHSPSSNLLKIKKEEDMTERIKT